MRQSLVVARVFCAALAIMSIAIGLGLISMGSYNGEDLTWIGWALFVPAVIASFVAFLCEFAIHLFDHVQDWIDNDYS